MHGHGNVIPLSNKPTLQCLLGEFCMLQAKHGVPLLEGNVAGQSKARGVSFRRELQAREQDSRQVWVGTVDLCSRGVVGDSAEANVGRGKEGNRHGALRSC